MKVGWLTIGLIFLYTAAEGQILRASYSNGQIEFDLNDNGSLNDVHNYAYKVYRDDSISDRTVNCIRTTTYFTCRAEVGELNLGLNVLYISYTKAGAEFKSNPVLIHFSIKEDLKSIKICKAGSYTFQRITEVSKLSEALNKGYVAFSYATASAIYVINCVLE
jgi:hypothetical protein